jgi:hypothetical protein
LNEETLLEGFEDVDSREINFDGIKTTIPIKTDNPDSKLLDKVDSVLKTVCSPSLYNYLYKMEKRYYEDEVNTDPYYDGKKIQSGKDLMNACKEQITHKNTKIFINDRRNMIYFCGEYWCDEEHGYCITFPGGKFVKGNESSNKYNSKITRMGLYSDAL